MQHAKHAQRWPASCDGHGLISAGCCGRIGSVISSGLAQLGVTIIIADHRGDQACQCVEGTTRPESITTMMEEAVHLTGWVDILVNCVNLRRAFLLSQTIGWQLFQTAFQSTNCRELIELDIRDEQQHQIFMESGICRTRCMQQIEVAVLQLFDLHEPAVWDRVLREVS